MATVFSIIVTYQPDLSHFKEVIKAHVGSGTNGIIVVDNGSENSAEIEALLNNYTNDILLIAQFLGENKGIGFAQNIGIKMADSYNSSHILLFDQDSISSSNIVRDLVEQERKLVQAGVKVGAIGPCYFDGRSGNYYPQVIFSGISLKKLWPDKEPDTNIKVSFIIASGSLIRLSTLNDVGLMNEDLFIDCVDIEWCFRAAASGYSIYASKAVTISHTIGDKRIISLGREISIHSPLRKYYMMRNNLLMSRYKWIPAGYKLRILITTIFRTPAYMYDMRFNAKYVKFMMRGIYDGILNKKGIYKSR